MTIKLFESDFDEATAIAVADVVRDGWLTNGPRTLEFERLLSEIIGVNKEQIIAVSSATAAIHLSLIDIGIGPGDEVITPALTFVSDFNVIQISGGIPVFCDVASLNEWTPSLDQIKEVYTSKTKAIMLTHFAGIPAKSTLEIRNFCSEHEIPLIEDCAHALGAKINGFGCGTIGDYGAFSFYSNKNISTGEGGALVVSDAKASTRLRRMRSHGMTTSTLDREKGRAFSYDVVAAGLNYRIDEIRSTLGIHQLMKFNNKHAIRKQIIATYLLQLKNSEIRTPFINDFTLDERLTIDHIFPVLLPVETKRDSVITHLASHGIQSSLHYPAPWNMSAYMDLCDGRNFPITKSIIDRELTLPLHTKMNLYDAEYVSKILLEAIN